MVTSDRLHSISKFGTREFDGSRCKWAADAVVILSIDLFTMAVENRLFRRQKSKERQKGSAGPSARIGECKGWTWSACTAPWDLAGRVHQQAKAEAGLKAKTRKKDKRNTKAKRAKQSDKIGAGGDRRRKGSFLRLARVPGAFLGKRAALRNFGSRGLIDGAGSRDLGVVCAFPR